ncbi:proton-conducting transporter transmembrane domain-containing protein [Anaerovorax sp. IOR16]|uniref:proton-conducting transporter transmembrane domain-containing protein n=1 Tax=Anaerovorax sp. IOR16 TaxID=2773458 RepID=UPI0019D0C5C1|nr:proton-conducting transporter membrane subunit [Anaerovorax sp. IOR16]
MTTNLPLLPVLIPMISGILLLFCRKNVIAQRFFSFISCSLMLFVTVFLLFKIHADGIMVFCAGGWSPPFGIVFVADLFSCIVLCLSALLFFTGLLFSFETIGEEREKHDFYVLWQFLMMGINGTFLTGDLFNLFVFFEIMLLSSYALLVHGASKAQLRETFKYLLINIISSTVFLIALGVLYAMLGTMNMADAAQKASTIENQGFFTVIAMLLLTVFGIKAAMFPLYFWLPKVHTVATASVSSIFSGLVIKVGAYAMIRTFTLIFIGDTAHTHLILIVLAILSIFLGVFGAVSQMNYKSILAYHSISQIGYIILGLGLFSVSSLTGSIYFLFHHGVVKGCLFLTAGVTEKITGTKDLKKMGGLLASYPALGWTFFIVAMSLAGVPPLSGFFAKYMIAFSAVQQENYWALGCAIGAGILTLFSMIKLFLYVFWGKAPREYIPAEGFQYGRALIPCFILASVSLLLGIFAQPIFSLCNEAAEQLMAPQAYIDIVLNTIGGR